MRSEAEGEADLTRAREDVEAERRLLELERERLAVDRARLDAELELARRIQLRLMPSIAPRMGTWDLAVLYEPARVIGGDFYDVFPLPGVGHEVGDHIGVAIADVTGKGITAALLMAFARAVMRTAAYNALSPADTLERTNRVFAGDVRTGLFLTAFVARLGPGGVIGYASAGHEPALVWRARSGRVVSTTAGGTMLGLLPTAGAVDASVRLAPGDVLLAYTDGATDARGADGRRFGERRLRRAFAGAAPGGPDAVVQGVRKAIDGFCDAAPDPADDLTLVAVARAPD